MTPSETMTFSSTCTTTTTTTATASHEEPTLGASSGANFDIDYERARQRRRHSSYQPRAWSVERENIQHLVDRFLADLGRRLEMMESYGHIKIDEGMKRAHDTLHAVHDRCVCAGDGVMDAGRRRARVMLDTLEGRYQGALETKGTLEQRAREGVKLLESVCSDLEKRAYDLHLGDGFLAATGRDMLDSGMLFVDSASAKATETLREGADAARRARERLTIKVETAIAQAREHGLITYDALPEPWRVNPHITSGYRFTENKLDCLRSCVTTISNETVNIYSHFIGLIIILTLAFYVYPHSTTFTDATRTLDIVIAGTFFFAAAKCLVCSTLWHAMNAISNQTLMERFACVDYTGISLLVAASIMTTEYTAFYCEPWSRWIYLATTLALGTAGTILPWHPTFNRADMAWLRVGFYVSLAATGFLPVVQLIYERGWAETVFFYKPITESIAVYLTGALLYAAKLPERWRPGWFDFVGGSHNLWHFAVLGGILFHYVAMQKFFTEAFRRAEMNGCSVY